MLTRREEYVGECSSQHELFLEEEDDCFAIDTEPNDRPLLVKYAEESDLEERENQESESETACPYNQLTVLNNQAVEGEDAPLLTPAAVVKGDDEAEPIEKEKEQFCWKPDANVVIPIGKEHLNQCATEDLCRKKARTAAVDEGGHGIVKRTFIRIDSRRLCQAMNPVLVPFHNHRTEEKTGDEVRDVRVKDEAVGVRTQKLSECSATFEMINVEGEDEGSEMAPTVQILDIVPFVEKGLVSPFVSSKRFHASMVEDESPNDVGPTASDVFREEVLRILQKPFDNEEYRELREAIKVGSYLDHHQDVKRKLKTFRHKRRKCLTILRGFFFWLQNITREGSFQPWTDRQCRAVEPPLS